MALGDWKAQGVKADGGKLSPSAIIQEGYQRLMTIQPHQIDYNGSDPWMALSGLRLLAEDKSFLHGAIGLMQLPDALTYQLLMHYRTKWEQASRRHRYPNGMENAGRKAANLWILNGAKGFIDWCEVEEPP